MAKRALKTKLKVNDTAVAGLTSIGGLELSADTIDVTTLDSDGGYREFIQGFKDGGEVSIEGFFDPAKYGEGQTTLYDLFESGDVTPFKIEFPPEMKASWKFDGVVTGYGTSASLEDPLAFNGSIKVSGKPELVIEA